MAWVCVIDGLEYPVLGTPELQRVGRDAKGSVVHTAEGIVDEDPWPPVTLVDAPGWGDAEPLLSEVSD